MAEFVDFHEMFQTMSLRKCRLFAVACCYSVWNQMGNIHSRNAVYAAEKFADGKMPWQELLAIHKDAREGINASPTSPAVAAYYASVYYNDRPTTVASLSTAVYQIAYDSNRDVYYTNLQRLLRILQQMHKPLCPDLSWSNETIKRIAQTIYQRGEFENLPILADALEEAGCEDAVILQHCRNEEVHYRGDWIVDLILGLE